MSLEFEKNEPVVTVVEEKIIIAGKKVGTIKERYSNSKSHRFHAIIEVDVRFGGDIIMGYGQTKKEAVVNALERGKKEAEAALLFIKTLRLSLAV